MLLLLLLLCLLIVQLGTSSNATVSDVFFWMGGDAIFRDELLGLIVLLLLQLLLLDEIFAGQVAGILLHRVRRGRTGQTSGRSLARDDVHMGYILEADFELLERFRHTTRHGIT